MDILTDLAEQPGQEPDCAKPLRGDGAPDAAAGTKIQKTQNAAGRNPLPDASFLSAAVSSLPKAQSLPVILSLTAQKPHSTGSGVYLTELVRGFDRLGLRQAVVAGICREDTVSFPEGTAFYPVFYGCEALPYPVAGMSDEMPYDSTRYRDMTPEMTEQFCRAFSAAVQKAVGEMNPSLILCHHLYLLTALAEELLRNGGFQGKLAGICHGSDLRQIKKNPLKREYIKSRIRNLDRIWCLHREQREDIIRTFSCDPSAVKILGTGYNGRIFREIPGEGSRNAHRAGEKTVPAGSGSQIRVIFAGKLSEKKGVMSLLRSLRLLPKSLSGRLFLTLAGGCGNEEEYREIRRLAEPENGCPCPVFFAGRLSQEELAAQLNQSDIFVLPSFYEGLPLSLIEALACGLTAVCTDLPGIRPWMDENVPGHGVLFVAPPDMKNEDEPAPGSLPAFEKALAAAIETAAERIAPLPEPAAARTGALLAAHASQTIAPRQKAGEPSAEVSLSGASLDETSLSGVSPAEVSPAEAALSGAPPARSGKSRVPEPLKSSLARLSWDGLCEKILADLRR